jgi:hypothetical protein
VAVDLNGGQFAVVGIANHEEAGSCWASWIHRATWASGADANLYEHDVEPEGSPNGRIYVEDAAELRAWKYGGDGGFPTSSSQCTPPTAGQWNYLVVRYQAAGLIELFLGDEATAPVEVASYVEQVDNIVATYWNESATGVKGRFGARQNQTLLWSGGVLEGWIADPVTMTYLPTEAEMDEMRLGTFDYTGKGVMFRLQTAALPITDIGPNTYTVTVETGTMLLVDDPEPAGAAASSTYLHHNLRRGGDGWPG